MSNAILKRMPYGIAGDISRQSQATVEAQLFDEKTPFNAFGVAGKIVNGKFVPVSGGEKSTDLYGLLVRPFPTQGQGDVANILRRGYMTVKNNNGVSALGGQVFVRVAKPTQSKPLGGIEAAADADNTVALTGAVFMAASDADGNVEIAYNI